MTYLDNIVSIFSLLLSGYLIVCLLKPYNLLETVLFSFCISAALIATWGYILSTLDRLADLWAWSALGIVTAIIAAVFFAIFKPRFVRLHTQIYASAKTILKWYSAETTGYEKTLLTPMFLVALFVALFNLVLVIFTAPHAWDSLTYHLARMAYYLQQGNYAFFGANYWAQAIHPKNSTSLLIYTFLVTGRNENLTQLIEYISHWFFVLCVYGISIKTGFNRTQGIFSALIGSMLIVGALLAVSAQNDLFIAACFGAATYALFAFREKPRGAYLLAGGLGIALALGAKSSALLALPSIAIIAIYVLAYRVDKKTALKNILFFGLSVFASSLILVLPAGYVDNYKRFGHPIAPLDVRQMHSFEGADFGSALKGGTYNALRFGFDFLALDGLPPTNSVNKIQEALGFIPEKILSAFAIDLESDYAIGFSPFYYHNPRTLYWGILGFGVVWAAVIFSLFRLIGNKDALMLSTAAVVFFLVQAYSGPYDASRGRYFMICALFAAPVAGHWIAAKPKWIRVYLPLVLFAGCFSAVFTLASQTPLFSMDRARQFAFENPQYYERFRAFDFIVPQDAVVAVYLYPNAYEYPLFGQQLTRTILPLNSFYQGLQPIPKEAEYLLYVKGYPCPDEKDKHLEGDWFLRKLNDNNRECKFP
jgi:hypothetical protein